MNRQSLYLFIVGGVSIVGGVASWSAPAAVVLAGLIAWALAVLLLDRTPPTAGRDRG